MRRGEALPGATGAALPLWPVAVAIYALMLPVTAIVPVLEDLTGGRHAGLSDFAKHLFMVSNMLAAILFAPLAGRLSDRIGRRRPIIVGSLLANIVVLLLMARDAPYAVHLLLRFFDGGLHITALTLLMTLAMDRGQRQEGSGRAMGLAGAAMTLGVATGAPLGGLLGQGEATRVLEAGAALSLLLALWTAVLPEAERASGGRGRLPPGGSRREGRASAAGAGLSALPLRDLLLPYVFTFFDRLSVGFIVSTMTLYLRSVLGASPAQIGLLMGSFMLPFALLTYPFGRLSQGAWALPMMMLGSSLYGGALVALALAPLPMWQLLMPAGGVAAALMFAPSLVLTAQAAQGDTRARAMGGFHAAGSLGFLLGPLVGGGVLWLAERLGGSGWLPAFCVMAVGQWLCVLLFLPRLRRRFAAGRGVPT